MAGLEGHQTEATRKLSTAALAPPGENDATLALGATAATQALGADRTRVSRPGLREHAPATPARPPQAERRRKRRRIVTFTLALAALMAGVAVALIIATATETKAEQINEVDIPQQVEKLKDFINSNTE